MRHRQLRVVGFWPYAGQEARLARQQLRHRAEREQKRLLGGNIDSNLVNLHFHAQQSEWNLIKLLKTQLFFDHFLVIDNDAEPRVLLDYTEQSLRRRLCEREELEAARKMLELITSHKESLEEEKEKKEKKEKEQNLKEDFVKEDFKEDFDDFCSVVFRCAQFFLPPQDALLLRYADRLTLEEPFQEPEQVLPVLQHLDESASRHRFELDF